MMRALVYEDEVTGIEEDEVSLLFKYLHKFSVTVFSPALNTYWVMWIRPYFQTKFTADIGLPRWNSQHKLQQSNLKAHEIPL